MTRSSRFQDDFERSVYSRFLWIIPVVFIVLLLLVTSSCTASKPMGVETIAYSRGVVDMADDAIALLTGNQEALQKRGLLHPSKDDIRARIEDWKTMKRTALIMMERNGIDVQFDPLMPSTPIPGKPDSTDSEDVLGSEDEEVIK